MAVPAKLGAIAPLIAVPVLVVQGLRSRRPQVCWLSLFPWRRTLCGGCSFVNTSRPERAGTLGTPRQR